MEKDYLFDALQDLVEYQAAKYPKKNPYKVLLEAMLTVMSEDNLHEVVAAVSELEQYQTGITFWYKDRADYIDRDFWN